MFIYDIFLDDELVGDSGDEMFDDKCQAKLDAEEYVKYLSEEHERSDKDFEIVIYERVEE